MIKRLRKRFIIITMCSVIAVLTLILGAINISSYQHIGDKADITLGILAENGGYFPTTVKHGDRQDAPPPDQFLGRPPDTSAEMPFETRYFTVLLDEAGQIITTDIGFVAAISSSGAETYALEVWQDGDISGFQDNYRYLVHDTGNGTMILFVDCARELNQFYTFLNSSFLVSLAGTLAVFVMVLLLSKRAIQPIAESYSKQKRFITDAGHELKTPLTIIDANTEILEMEIGENEWTDSTRKQVRRLATLTESLVTLARMDEAADSIPMASFSLSDTVNDIVESFIPLAETQEKDMQSEIEPNITYAGNKTALSQLVSILADNAIKYSTTDEPILFKLYRQGKHVVISCRNGASDLSAGDQNVLFERFHRADASRNSKSGGHGIGLSIAQSIVLAHKGKIEAQNMDGYSLTITVTL